MFLFKEVSDAHTCRPALLPSPRPSLTSSVQRQPRSIYFVRHFAPPPKFLSQAFIDKFRYNANRAALVQSRIKALERLAGGR